MTQLFPLLVIAIVLAADGGAVPVAPGIASHPLLSIGFSALVPLVIVAAAAIALRIVRRQLDRTGAPRTVVMADTIVATGRVLLLIGHGMAVFGAGSLDAVRQLLGDRILVDELAAILPPVLGATALWWLQYPIERRVRESFLIRRLDQGAPVYAIPRRSRYVFQQLRLHMLLLLVPVIIILALGEIVGLLFETERLAELPAWSADLATLTMGLGVFMFAPMLARLILSVAPLRDGPVHDDLVDICRRHRIRVRAFLVWLTDGAMINAAVMGLVGPLRYVLLTDALIQSLQRDQIRAVMAHEIGHVRRHHMLWMLLSLLALLLVGGFVVSLVLIGVDRFADIDDERWRWWVDGAATLASAAIALLGFGWISRRYERQADTFAVQHLSGLAAPATTDASATDGDSAGEGEAASGADGNVTAEAVEAMRSALEQVARLNNVNPRRRSWRHGSIAWRQAYLVSIVGLPVHRLPIDRLVAWSRVVVVALLVGLGGFAGWLEWQMSAPAAGVTPAPVAGAESGAGIVRVGETAP